MNNEQGKVLSIREHMIKKGEKTLLYLSKFPKSIKDQGTKEVNENLSKILRKYDEMEAKRLQCKEL